MFALRSRVTGQWGRWQVGDLPKERLVFSEMGKAQKFRKAVAKLDEAAEWEVVKLKRLPSRYYLYIECGHYRYHEAEKSVVR